MGRSRGLSRAGWPGRSVRAAGKSERWIRMTLSLAFVAAPVITRRSKTSAARVRRQNSADQARGARTTISLRREARPSYIGLTPSSTGMGERLAWGLRHLSPTAMLS